MIDSIAISGIALALCIGAASARAQPAIQKCVDADNRVTYQDSACEAGETTTGWILRDTTPPDPISLQRARDELKRADRAAERRAFQNAAEDALRVRQAEVDVRAWAAYTNAQASDNGEPTYYYAGGAQPLAASRVRGTAG